LVFTTALFDDISGIHSFEIKYLGIAKNRKIAFSNHESAKTG